MATKVEELQNKVRIKLALAEKYETLSNRAGSKPARRKLIAKSNRFRRQAREFQRSADAAKTSAS